jgi:hypothetical protein
VLLAETLPTRRMGAGKFWGTGGLARLGREIELGRHEADSTRIEPLRGCFGQARTTMGSLGLPH